FSSRRRHTRLVSDWSSDVCSSDLSAVSRARPDIADQRADDAIAGVLTMLFQIIFDLHPFGCGHRDDLADISCGYARAIAVAVAQIGRASCRERGEMVGGDGRVGYR